MVITILSELSIYSVYPTLYLLTDDGQPGGGRGLVRVGGHLAAVEAGLGAAHVVQPEHEPRGRAGEDGHAEAGLQDVGRGPVVRQEHLIYCSVFRSII